MSFATPRVSYILPRVFYIDAFVAIPHVSVAGPSCWLASLPIMSSRFDFRIEFCNTARLIQIAPSVLHRSVCGNPPFVGRMPPAVGGKSPNDVIAFRLSHRILQHRTSHTDCPARSTSKRLWQSSICWSQAPSCWWQVPQCMVSSRSDFRIDVCNTARLIEIAPIALHRSACDNPSLFGRRPPVVGGKSPNAWCHHVSTFASVFSTARLIPIVPIALHCGGKSPNAWCHRVSVFA